MVLVSSALEPSENAKAGCVYGGVGGRVLGLSSKYNAGKQKRDSAAAKICIY